MTGRLPLLGAWVIFGAFVLVLVVILTRGGKR